MKCYTNLYGRVSSFENLYLAFKKAARGKRSQPNVAAFEFELDNYSGVRHPQMPSHR